MWYETNNSNIPARYEYQVTATYLPYRRSSFTDLGRQIPTGPHRPGGNHRPKTEENLFFLVYIKIKSSVNEELRIDIETVKANTGL